MEPSLVASMGDRKPAAGVSNVSLRVRRLFVLSIILGGMSKSLIRSVGRITRLNTF